MYLLKREHWLLMINKQQLLIEPQWRSSISKHEAGADAVIAEKTEGEQ